MPIITTSQSRVAKKSQTRLNNNHKSSTSLAIGPAIRLKKAFPTEAMKVGSKAIVAAVYDFLNPKPSDRTTLSHSGQRSRYERPEPCHEAGQ
jgi:hypothetical protein